MSPAVRRTSLEYVKALRAHFARTRPADYVSVSVSTATAGITYFAVIPASLKMRRLKVVIVFVHSKQRFEVWLRGRNKRVQMNYRKLVERSGWPKHRRPDSPYAIVAQVLSRASDLADPATLTGRIERKAIRFISDVEGFLSGQEERLTGSARRLEPLLEDSRSRGVNQ